MVVFWATPNNNMIGCPWDMWHGHMLMIGCPWTCEMATCSGLAVHWSCYMSTFSCFAARGTCDMATCWWFAVHGTCDMATCSAYPMMKTWILVHKVHRCIYLSILSQSLIKSDFISSHYPFDKQSSSFFNLISMESRLPGHFFQLINNKNYRYWMKNIKLTIKKPNVKQN